MLTLYSNQGSGNCYKVRLLLTQVGLPFRVVERFTEQLVDKRELGYHALGVMERHLRGYDFFAAGSYTIADIALYAYTHVAHQGGFDLERFGAVRVWLDRVAGWPKHIPITHVC